MTKKVLMLIVIILSITCLAGCGQNNTEVLSENIKKMELTGNLITYQAYYHNVIEYNKPAGSGITGWFQKDRKLFAEYTGTIKYGINLSEVKIEVIGNEIKAFIPKAKVIGEPNVDKDDFKEENFIESEDGLYKNPITATDSSNAFNDAQKKMKEEAEKDEDVLDLAQKRAKIILEENISQFSGLNKNEYTINWEYE